MTFSPVSLRAGCKVNLYLHVGERLANGYHSLESLFLPLEEPHDVLEVRKAESPSPGTARVSFVTASDPHAPVPGIDPVHNTVTRAAAWHAAMTGFRPALDICVRKGIPHGSGLGGGSSDAAALLLWLRGRAIRAGITVPPFRRFLEDAAAVGADVPFFLQGKTALVSGLGERLRPADTPHAGHFLLLLCPGIVISTAWAFAALDAGRKEKNASGGLTSNGSRATPTFARTPGQGNDFEPLVFAAYPELARLHGRLLRSGALKAGLSGTGSSLFGLYLEEKIARQAAKCLARGGLSVYIQRLPKR